MSRLESRPVRSLAALSIATLALLGGGCATTSSLDVALPADSQVELQVAAYDATLSVRNDGPATILCVVDGEPIERGTRVPEGARLPRLNTPVRVLIDNDSADAVASIYVQLTGRRLEDALWVSPIRDRD